MGNQELLGLINLDSPSLAPIGVLVDDIRNWVPLFHFISFSFIKKNCNRASHALATEALSSNSYLVFSNFFLIIFFFQKITMNSFY